MERCNIMGHIVMRPGEMPSPIAAPSSQWFHINTEIFPGFKLSHMLVALCGISHFLLITLLNPIHSTILFPFTVSISPVKTEKSLFISGPPCSVAQVAHCTTPVGATPKTVHIGTDPNRALWGCAGYNQYDLILFGTKESQ